MAGPLVNGRRRDMFVQHQLSNVFIPSFFQHCLSSLCAAEMLKLHFSDAGSLEVCAHRQVSVQNQRERNRDWKKDKEGKKLAKKKKKNPESLCKKGGLPLIPQSEFMLKRSIQHARYAL